MKIENLTRLRRIERTLRDTGKPVAIYLADDLAEVVMNETGTEGLTTEELAAIRSGSPILAIKMVRARKSAGSTLFGLKEAKDFVEAAAEKMGYYRPGTGLPFGKNRWTTTPFEWE